MNLENCKRMIRSKLPKDYIKSLDFVDFICSSILLFIQRFTFEIFDLERTRKIHFFYSLYHFCFLSYFDDFRYFNSKIFYHLKFKQMSSVFSNLMGGSTNMRGLNEFISDIRECKDKESETKRV